MRDAGWLLGADSGGSGLRVALARRDTGHRGGSVRTVGTISAKEPVRTGPDGIEPAHMLGQLLPAARSLLASAGAGDASVGAVCVGAAGMATLGRSLRAELPGALSEALGTPAEGIALAADAVTAYAGALGQRPGAVLAAGTGLIALGTDLQSWRRADGWGHLLGDCGSGAWIGRAGLEAALRAYDGRTGGSAALRERAEALFGAPLSGLPGSLYPRTDRAAVLASFAPEVARCAPHDPVAEAVLLRAAAEMAASASAVCPRDSAATVGLTGGLFRLGGALRAPLERELAAALPEAQVTDGAGDPLDGAVLVASWLAEGGLTLPLDATMLSVG